MDGRMGRSGGGEAWAALEGKGRPRVAPRAWCEVCACPVCACVRDFLAPASHTKGRVCPGLLGTRSVSGCRSTPSTQITSASISVSGAAAGKAGAGVVVARLPWASGTRSGTRAAQGVFWPLGRRSELEVLSVDGLVGFGAASWSCGRSGNLRIGVQKGFRAPSGLCVLLFEDP